MDQSRLESLLEAVVNQCVGMGYAIIFYYLAFGFSVWQGFATTAFFACAGLVRVFLIRRAAIALRNRRINK
jgi:hypothetical protein